MRLYVIQPALFCTLLLVLFFNGIAQPPGVKTYDLPFNPAETRNTFNLVGTSLISMPAKGGIYELIFKTWLIPPSAKQGIVNYDLCFADTSLVLAIKKDSALLLVKGKNNEQTYISKTYCKIPPGNCQIMSVGVDSFFLLHYNKSFSTLSFFSVQNGLQTILTTKDTITAFHIISPTQLIVATGTKLFSLKPDSQPALLTIFPAYVDGLAQDNNGHLIVSTKKGICWIDSKQNVEQLTTQTHGFIRCENNTLFVLDRERHKVIQIRLQSF